MPAEIELVLLVLGLAATGYLLGSVNTALIISTAWKLPDPRAGGSGNPGATNMVRTANWAAGAATLLGDAGKAALAVGLALPLAGWFGADWPPLAAAAMLAAVAGHVWPLYHRFRGGKGVAPWVGAMLVAAPVILLFWAVTWLATLALYRKVGLASVVAAAAAPLYAFAGMTPAPLAWAMLAAAVVVVFRHADNLRQMLRTGEDV